MKPELKIKTKTALIPSLSIRQALKILQLPTSDLHLYLMQQIEQNPVLQITEETKEVASQEIETPELDFEKSGFEVLDAIDPSFALAVFEEDERPMEKETISSPSLFQHLIAQAREVLEGDALLKAEEMIGNLDSRGFFLETPSDPNILKIIQSFDPPGIGAQSLQEALLIQLARREKKETLAYFLIETYFDEILSNRLLKIADLTGLSVKEIHTALSKELSSCSFNPAGIYSRELNDLPLIDIYLKPMGSQWHIEMGDETLPRFCISYPPLDLLTPPEQQTLRLQINEGKQLIEALKKRRKTLERIIVLLVQKQASFFNGMTSKKEPLSMQQFAQQLGIHASTLTRAVSGKMIACPQGVFPLRSFFTTSLKTSSGTEVSNQTAHQLLLRAIENEDETSPLSDTALAKVLAQAGIPCARRTVAKYRQLLKIPSTKLRKKWC